jgi:protein-S-isoprenylcysteine O-methyltransferase Ste14
MNKYILLIIYWVGYYTIHSLLASNFAKTHLAFFGRYYRLVYNIISILGFIAVLLYTAIIPPEWLFMRSGITKFFGLMPTTYGILIIRHSFRIYSIKDFLGTSQLKNDYKKEAFVTEGMLQHVRHPLYLGTLLIVCGFFLFSPSLANLLVMLITIIYLFIGIYFEEQKLLKVHGKAYRDYKEKVPMIIPRTIRIFHDH